MLRDKNPLWYWTAFFSVPVIAVISTLTLAGEIPAARSCIVPRSGLKPVQGHHEQNNSCLFDVCHRSSVNLSAVFAFQALERLFLLISQSGVVVRIPLMSSPIVPLSPIPSFSSFSVSLYPQVFNGWDLDGVPDHAGSMPGTLPGVQVDERGCEIVIAPPTPEVNLNLLVLVQKRVLNLIVLTKTRCLSWAW